MPRFAANLSMMFTDVPFMQRFKAAAECGFDAVEYLFPYAYPAEDLAAVLRENALTQALCNLSAGVWEQGERGCACVPGREAEFEASVEQGIAYAKVMGHKMLHAMAGLAPAGVPWDTLEATYKGNIARAARMAAPHGLTICLEPINHRSMPGYFLHRQAQAAAYIAELGAPNVRLQFDAFHVQMEEGCVALKLREYFGITAHYQIAGVPDRHEPDTGELRYEYLFNLLDELGYAGFVGCEYNPAGDTAVGLGWFTPYKKR